MKIIAFSIIVWAITAMTSPRFAEANFNLNGLQDVTTVTALNKFRNAFSTACPISGEFTEFKYEFFYEQLMAIPGYGTVWVPTEAVYPFGHYEVILIDSCEDGTNVYFGQMFPINSNRP